MPRGFLEIVPRDWFLCLMIYCVLNNNTFKLFFKEHRVYKSTYEFLSLSQSFNNDKMSSGIPTILTSPSHLQLMLPFNIFKFIGPFNDLPMSYLESETLHEWSTPNPVRTPNPCKQAPGALVVTSTSPIFICFSFTFYITWYVKLFCTGKNF